MAARKHPESELPQKWVDPRGEHYWTSKTIPAACCGCNCTMCHSGNCCKEN